MSQFAGLRATSAASLAAALLAGIAVAWLVAAGGSGGAGTNARHLVPTAIAHVATSTGATTTLTEVRTVTQPAQTVTEPAQTVTRTATVQLAPPTTTIAHTTTNVAVIPTSTTTEQPGDQIPWWGWLLIGLGVAAVGVGLFAAGHRHGAQGAGGAQGGGQPPAGR